MPTFTGKCLHRPLISFFASLFAFFPVVCFKTGFQIGRVPSVEDCSNGSGASASRPAFPVWCGFSFFLSVAPEGGNAGLPRVWQKFTASRMLRIEPFSVPCHPAGGAVFRALRLNARLLAQVFEISVSILLGAGGVWNK